MKFSYGKTVLLGFGFLGVSVIWSIYNAFVPVFLSEKFHLEPRWIAFFITLDNLAGLLIQPPVGVWSDKIRTPIGRRMPFILVGAPIAALAFAFVPMAARLPLFVFCTSSLLVSMALWRTPSVALVADVTPSPQRSQASGVLSLMGGIGAVMAYFGGGALYKINPAYPFWAGSAVVLLAALLMLLFVREPKVFATQEVGIDESQPGFFQSLQLIFEDKDKSALCLLLALFCMMVGYTAVEGFFSLYALNHLGMEAGDSARLLGQLSLVFIAFALPAGSLSAKIGRRITMMLGLLLMAALLLVIYFVPAPTLTRELFALPLLGSVPVVGALLMGVGIAWAMIIIPPLPMLSDMTDAKRIGTYTGLYYLFTSLAAIAGPNINGWIVAKSNQNYNVVMLFAPVMLLAAWGLMWGVKRGEIVATSE
jgi:MFS family permease